MLNNPRVPETTKIQPRGGTEESGCCCCPDADAGAHIVNLLLENQKRETAP